jgi:hypothetical protein
MQYVSYDSTKLVCPFVGREIIGLRFQTVTEILDEGCPLSPQVQTLIGPLRFSLSA